MDADKTVEARWYIDSETGEQILVDQKTGAVIGHKDKNGNITSGKSN